MTTDAVKTLQNIKGIGKVLSQRLVDAGLDSYAKIVAAGESGLAAIAGLQPGQIPSILAQAATLAAEESSEPPESPSEVAAADGSSPDREFVRQEKRTRKLADLQSAAGRIRDRIQDLVSDLIGKKSGLADKASGLRLQKEMGKFLTSLSKVEAKFLGRLKKARKQLNKSEKRLESLDAAGPTKLLRGLKKARRPLQRILD